jgi:hypothetical protein
MWSNLLSNPIAWAAAIVGAVVFRRWLGRHLAAWWHRHHGPHAREDLAAMEDRLKTHMTAELGRLAANGGTHEARHVASPPGSSQR